MDIDKLTLGELKQITAIAGGRKETPFKIGEKYYFRTVTHHQTGRIVAITGQFVTLEDAAWVADSGRWMAAIEDGVLDEVEPVTVPVIVNLDSLIDAYMWKHELPRKQT